MLTACPPCKLNQMKLQTIIMSFRLYKLDIVIIKTQKYERTVPDGDGDECGGDYDTDSMRSPVKSTSMITMSMEDEYVSATGLNNGLSDDSPIDIEPIFPFPMQPSFISL